MLTKKEFFIINSNYDFTNGDNSNKININNLDFLNDLPNESIIVLQDANLGGYMVFLENVKKYNEKNNMNLHPVISLKTELNGEEKIFYAKNADDVAELLKFNNPFFDKDEFNKNQNLFTSINDENKLIFKMDSLYGDFLNIKTGYFSPKYNGKYEPLLNPENDFFAVKEYLKSKVVEKLKININDFPEYISRINDEITVLSGGNQMKQNFLEYMFVVSDMVLIAKENDIRVGPGRGSGAGSLTAFLLDITEVNPIEDDLSFERFLNKDRPSFPDFDLDFDSSKLNILKSLIQEKLGYSIIQMGTLNSHSHNDFLPNLKNITFLSDDEQQKIFFDIKNDFNDIRNKEDIIKDGQNYIYKKLNKIGIDVNKCYIEINNDINKKLNNIPFFYENNLRINALKKTEEVDLKQIFLELYNSNNDYKRIITKIGSSNLLGGGNKTALFNAVNFKVKILELIGEDHQILSNLELEFQKKLFKGLIKGRFLDFLVINQKQNPVEDYNFENLQNFNYQSTEKDVGDFSIYSKYILDNLNNYEFSLLHDTFIEKLNENNKVFYSSIFNYIKNSIKPENNIYSEVTGIIKYIEDIKIINLRNLSKSNTIINEICGNNGLINSFIKNFETYKGLGSHASGHIIVNNSQFSEMLKIFPVLQQNGRDPVMGVNHKYVEKFGGVKFDLLGLKTLTVYEIARKLSNSKIEHDFWNRGNKVCEQIIDFLAQDRDFSFIFQAEGVEIKTALNIMGKELKSNSKIKLIDSVSNIIALARPGPIANGTLYDYLSGGKKTVENFDDSNVVGTEILNLKSKISKSLESTNGYLIYQEQIIEIAKIIGLSGGEADNFRRAISKKDSELLKEQENVFITRGLNLCQNNASVNGNKIYLESVFKNLASFAEYGFNKSHSVSYAMLLCEGAYYATEKPNEFITALLNVYGGEVGSLDGNNENKEVLKSNNKIKPLISFAGSLNVTLKPYWENYGINLIDVDKKTDKDYKNMTFLNSNNEVIISSKILNSKNKDILDYKTFWSIGNVIGKGLVTDISNLKYDNQKNYLLKNNNEDFKVEALAVFNRKNIKGGLEFTSSSDNGKKYTFYVDRFKQINLPKLNSGDYVCVDLNLLNNKQTNKISSSILKINKIEQSYYQNIYDRETTIEHLKPQNIKSPQINKNQIKELLEI